MFRYRLWRLVVLVLNIAVMALTYARAQERREKLHGAYLEFQKAHADMIAAGERLEAVMRATQREE